MHRRGELALNRRLDREVQRKYEVLAVLRVEAGAKTERELATRRIALDDETARHAAQHVVVAALDSVLPEPVVIDEPEDLRADRATRVEPLRLFLEAESFDPEGRDPVRRVLR